MGTNRIAPQDYSRRVPPQPLAMDRPGQNGSAQIDRIREVAPSMLASATPERGKLRAPRACQKKCSTCSPREPVSFLDSPARRIRGCRCDSPARDPPGFGRIQRRETVVVANDATSEGGILLSDVVRNSLLRAASKSLIYQQLPCVYLVDSRRCLPALAFRHFSRPAKPVGRIFLYQAPDCSPPWSAMGIARRSRDGIATAGAHTFPRCAREQSSPRCRHHLPGRAPAAGARS